MEMKRPTADSLGAVGVSRRDAVQQKQPGAELAIIIPTVNERENIHALVSSMVSALAGVCWEVLFVDDNSPDGTAALIRELGQSDSRIRVIQRIGRRGLASACIEGMLASSAPYLAVMDADLQHDERLLPEMLRIIKTENLDLVVGSRYITGGSVGDWSPSRHRISRFATWLAHRFVQTDIKDLMSGFFLLRGEILRENSHHLSGLGFKILLDILASSSRPLRSRELPYTFRQRTAGESKLDGLAAWGYGMLLLDKICGQYVPVRFVPFAIIGASGVLAHMTVLWFVFVVMKVSFGPAQAIATLCAMTTNFMLNNTLTYRDQRFRGWSLLRGWFSFCAACSLGAFANVGIATTLFAGNGASWILSSLSGVMVGAGWNFAVTSVYTWNTARRA